MSEAHRLSMALVLENLRRRGFSPGTVLDVGAHTGTPLLTLAFPQAHHVMIEPLVEHGPALHAACAALASAEYLIAAAGSKEGVARLGFDKKTLHSCVQGDSQSGLGENERLVRSIRLDQLVWERRFQEPYLVKIDVDGNEFDVLQGAAGLLGAEQIFIVEMPLFNDNMLKILQFFDNFGFVPFDLADPLYREKDDALWQFDLVMVHRDSFLRRDRLFA